MTTEQNRALGPIIADVAGLSLTPEERDRLRQPAIGGVILFSRNFADRAQLCELVREIKALRDPALIVSVDHEGGRVQRFREGFTAIPPMAELGELWNQDPQQACVAAKHWGQVLAQELRACGVDYSYTPCLDLDWQQSAVIGNRAFHGDPAAVAGLARALMLGLQSAGMANCLKHFPGHGWAEADSHVAMPVDDRDLSEILAADVAPYFDLCKPNRMGLATAVMPAHVVYSQVDDLPAGFSSIWLQDVLRSRVGFDGMIVSDDLSMAGACAVGGIVARVQAALSAGCDTALICNSPQLVDELLDGWSYQPTPEQALTLARRWERMRGGCSL